MNQPTSQLTQSSMSESDAQTALDVIRYFDALADSRASAAELVRATAVLAGCECGLELVDGRLWRFGATGENVPAPRRGGSTHAFFEVNGAPVHMWLERAMGAAPLDDLVIERASLAARTLLTATQTQNIAGLADPVLVDIILGDRESAADRCQALRRLGLVPELPLRVVALSVEDGRDPAAEAVALVARGRPMRSVYVTVVSGVAAVLIQHGADTGALSEDLRNVLRDRISERRACAGLRVGIGSSVDATSAQRSWHEALRAVRFAMPPGSSAGGVSPDDAVVCFESLGVLALLADVPGHRLRTEPDVVALNMLSANESGALDVMALEALCRTGSVRRAAQLLYLHHSTVSARLARVEDVLGLRLDDPFDRFRAQLALSARRLLQTSPID